MPQETQWSPDEAGLLTMLATHRGALSVGGLLLRSDGVLPIRSWEAFAESMGRLVAADLVIWFECRFFVTAAGRALSTAGQGSSFKDRFTETRLALDEHVARPEPADLGLTQDEYDEALAYVAEANEQRRNGSLPIDPRRAYSGYQKWADRLDAPPLTLGGCIEFLTFIEGLDVVVKTENATDSVRFEGTLGLPVPRSADPNDRKSAIFPVQTSGTDAAVSLVSLRTDRFTTATFWSADGVDYFTLKIRFDDGNSVTVADANAPSI